MLSPPNCVRVPCRRADARAFATASLAAAASRYDSEDGAQEHAPAVGELTRPAADAVTFTPSVRVVIDGNAVHTDVKGRSVESLQWVATRRGDILAEVLTRDAAVTFEWVTPCGAPFGVPAMSAPLSEWVGDELATAFEELIASYEPQHTDCGVHQLFEWCAVMAARVRAAHASPTVYTTCGDVVHGDWVGTLDVEAVSSPHEVPQAPPRGWRAC